MRIADWNIEEMTGYKPISTFYTDFSIADAFGVDAIKDTYNRALQWKGDIKMYTELIMVLNWKIWEHYESDLEKANLYQELWEAEDEWAMENLKGEDLTYYLRTTD